MKRHTLAIALLLGLAGPACSQGNQTPAPAYSGAPVNRATVNGSVAITTGNTFQTILASNFNTAVQRQALTIQNNNTTTDNCWIFLGSGTATKATSILLASGASYTRYFPFVPSDAIQATCLSNGDTIYLDTQ